MPPFLQHKCTLVFQTSFSWRNSILVLQSLSPQLLLLVMLSSTLVPVTAGRMASPLPTCLPKL